MNIDKLRVFVSVADNLSFTKAADSLHISQPTLSRHISDLERIVGADLFERNTRSVYLSALGKQFLVEARQIVQKYDGLMDRISCLASGISGSLTVGYLELFTQNLLPEAIKSFRKRCPLVEFHLVEMTLMETLDALAKGSIDAGFLMTYPDGKLPSELDSVHVVQGHIELVVSADHPLAAYDIVSPKELAGEKIITFNPDETPMLRENITRMCIQGGFYPSFVEGNHSPGAIFLLVQAGVGVTVLSSLVTSVLRTNKALRTVRLEGVDIPTGLVLAWRRGCENPCVSNFVDEVRAASNPKVLGRRAPD